MTILVQAPRTAGFILSSLGNLSMDSVTLVAGPALPAGQVLARDAGTGHYAPYDNASDTLGTAAAILYAPADARTGPAHAAVVSRLAEVIESELTGLDAPAAGDLDSRHIIVR